jgi:dTDP-4-amino-4,6-dideoxygalactose transaminase
MIHFNQLTREYYEHKDEYDEAVADVLASGCYVLGTQCEQFERDFASYIGSKYCVSLNSGLDALILAFRALGVGVGDEVIVPANTYIASILGITENGATPVLVEPDEYFNIDAEKIEAKITKKTKAILVVHLYGQAANMLKIKQIVEKHCLLLVEDCAQSHGAKYDGRTTGTWGSIGCFSFYPTKNIGAFGDAGAIVTNCKTINDKIRMLRNYGSVVKYYNDIPGINSRMDELQAALLRVKLKHYKDLLNGRICLADLYLANIKNPHIECPKIRTKSDAVWHLFVIKVKNRTGFQDFLRLYNISTQIHYPIPPHLSKAYRHLNLAKK